MKKKVKVYRVWIRNEWYLVDAPNKRIAKWCAANLYNHDYVAFATAKDVDKIELYKYKGA
jgi:hypothetical protein